LEAVGLRSEHYTRNTLQLVHAVESQSEYDFSRLENVDAVLDSPVPSLYLELLRYFPRARIILTVRDPDSWLRSHNGHYDRFCNHEKHLSHSRFSAKRNGTTTGTHSHTLLLYTHSCYTQTHTHTHTHTHTSLSDADRVDRCRG